MAQNPEPEVRFHPMKAKLTPSLIAALALVVGAVMNAAEKQSDAVTVTFHEAEKFTDARAYFGGSTDQGYLDTLASHLKKTAAKRLAPGQRLEVTFTDIDLAGDFLPGAGHNQDIRVIKDIYIPRQRLSFKLYSATGEVLAEGERRLSDLNFMNNTSIVGRNEPLFHDKALLSDWIAKEFKS